MKVEPISVVAAVIRSRDRFLVCQRNMEKRHGGLWEFPGGKVIAGESFGDALRREVLEELEVAASLVGEPLYSAKDGGSPFVIHFIEATIVGTPVPVEHHAIKWEKIPALTNMRLAPADQEFVQNYLIRRMGSIK